MGFEEYLKQHQFWDWAWQLFKGISPLLVALITIYINEQREKKRISKEKRLETGRAKYNELKEDIRVIENQMLELNALVWNTGKDLLNAIQSSGTDDENEYMTSYQKNNSDMLVLAKELQGYIEIKMVFHDDWNITAVSVFLEIEKYAHDLLNTLQWYNQKACITHRDNWEQLLDEVQTKLILLSQTTENRIVEYCVSLGDLLKDTQYRKNMNY